MTPYKTNLSVIQKVDSCVGSSGLLELQKKKGHVLALARKFSKSIPEKEFSMAAIQGLLMQFKTRPHAVIKHIDAWIDEERKKKAEREGIPNSVAVSPDEEYLIKNDQQSLETINELTGSSDPKNIPTAIWWPIGMT